MSKTNSIIGLNLDLDDNYLAKCVEQTVIAGISESLNGKNEIVSQLVHDVLNIKVDRNGNVSRYSSDNEFTLLEYHVRHAVEQIAKEELGSMVEEARPKIAKAIRAELSKEATMDNIVECFVNAVSRNLGGWRTEIDVKFEACDD